MEGRRPWVTFCQFAPGQLGAAGVADHHQRVFVEWMNNSKLCQIESIIVIIIIISVFEGDSDLVGHVCNLEMNKLDIICS